MATIGTTGQVQGNQVQKAFKHCGNCLRTLSVEDFAKNSSKKDGLQDRCKKCRAEHHQTHKHLRKQPSSRQKRHNMVRYKYGLNLWEVDAMLVAQGHACAICKSPDWGRPSPCVDHCHDTGKVRGLLCNLCNRALGMLKENPDVLEAAANYLRKHA